MQSILTNDIRTMCVCVCQYIPWMHLCDTAEGIAFVCRDTRAFDSTNSTRGVNLEASGAIKNSNLSFRVNQSLVDEEYL